MVKHRFIPTEDIKTDRALEDGEELTISYDVYTRNRIRDTVSILSYHTSSAEYPLHPDESGLAEVKTPEIAFYPTLALHIEVDD